MLTYMTEAMDRIHRLGQRRPVQAIKLVVEDSIESRIVQVCSVEIYLWRPSLVNIKRDPHSCRKRNQLWLMPLCQQTTRYVLKICLLFQCSKR